MNTPVTILWGFALFFTARAIWSVYQLYVGNTTKDTATKQSIFVLACLAGIFFLQEGLSATLEIVGGALILGGLVLLGMGIYNHVRRGVPLWKSIKVGVILTFAGVILFTLTGNVRMPTTLLDMIMRQGLFGGGIFFIAFVVCGIITYRRRKNGQPGGVPANIAFISLVLFIFLRFFAY